MNKLQPECGFAQRVLTQADRARNPSQSGCHAIPIQCQQDQIVFCAAPTTHHRGESRSSYSRDAAAALPRRDAIPVTLKTRTPLWSATITTSPHLTSRPGAATRTPLTRTWPAIASDAPALGTITLTFGTMLGAMISLAPLAAVVAFAPQLALRPARATMP